MASYLDEFSERDLQTLSGILETDLSGLQLDLRLRPWAIHDLLARDDVYDGVMNRHAHPVVPVSPFLLFAVLVYRAAGELRQAKYVADWSGPRTRLPVFDIEPLQEFLTDPGRVFFLAALLSSFAQPQELPVPVDHPFSLVSVASWLTVGTETQRPVLLRRLGDLALFHGGVFPDHFGSRPMFPVDAERLGRTVGMTSDEVLSLCDPFSLQPGLSALDALGSRWYEAAAEQAAPVVRDIAVRFSSARRVLNHVSDTALHKIDLDWSFAA